MLVFSRGVATLSEALSVDPSVCYDALEKYPCPWSETILSAFVASRFFFFLCAYIFLALSVSNIYINEGKEERKNLYIGLKKSINVRGLRDL